MRFSSWWKRPLTALGSCPICRRGWLPQTGCPDALSAHAASGVPVLSRARIEGGGDTELALTHNQANTKMDTRFNDAPCNRDLIAPGARLDHRVRSETGFVCDM